MDPNRIQGDVQRPYNAQEPEKKDTIDPEKFKKVMKVDESDETQKRHKRNLKKEEEEGEDEKTEETPAAPTQGAFAEFMSDKEELDNILTSESGGIRRQTAPENPPTHAPSPKTISTEGVEVTDTPSSPTQDLPPPPQYQSTNQRAPQEPQNTETPEPSTPASPAASPTPPAYDGVGKEPLPPRSTNEPVKQNIKTDETHPSEPSETHSDTSSQKDSKNAPKKSQKKRKHDDSLLASQPKLSDLKALKKKKRKSSPPPEEKVVAAPEKTRAGTSKAKKKTPSETTSSDPSTKKQSSQPSTSPPSAKKSDVPSTPSKEKEEPSVENVIRSPVGKEAAMHSDAQRIEYFHKASPQEIRKKKIAASHQKEEGEGIAAVPLSAPSGGESMDQKGGEKKHSEEESFIEASALTASIPLPPSTQSLPSITPSDAIPAYAKLSSEVYELFEKMGGVLMVQHHSGDEQATMTINKPDSIFDGSQIILTRYSTAPNAFNIQFEGNAKSVETFQQNIRYLEEAFKQANYDFETNILTPILQTNKKSPHLIRRKSAAGGKGGGGDQRQSKG